MIIASLLKLFSIGLLSLATANNSFVSLYNPTVVMYALGSFLNDAFVNEPSEAVKNVGLLLKLNFWFVAPTSSRVFPFVGGWGVFEGGFCLFWFLILGKFPDPPFWGEISPGLILFFGFWLLSCGCFLSWRLICGLLGGANGLFASWRTVGCGCLMGSLADSAFSGWLLNLGSIFWSVGGIFLSALGTSLDMVGFISFLGLGGNGLLGFDGAVICFWSGFLFLRRFWSLDKIDFWDLTKVWFGFKGTFKFDVEWTDWAGGFFLSSDFGFFCVLGGLFLRESISFSNFLVGKMLF